MPRILVVEDDPDIAELIVHYLQNAGHTTVRLSNGLDVLRQLRREPMDLVVLDVMLPGLNGMGVCDAIRADAATAHLPIIMLTARGEEADRIRGLETGADDYMTKPFSPKELVARAAAVLRRSRPSLAAERLDYAGIEMDLAAHRVRRDGGAIKLGPTEYRLLRHLLERPGRVFSRQQLLEMAWPHSEEIELRTVDVHIRRLRKAINDGGRSDIIRTVRSAGYALDIDGAL